MKIYGREGTANHEWAMKAALHEMKGIRLIERAKVKGLCYPLFAIVHYKGYTLTAQSLVRIPPPTSTLTPLTTTTPPPPMSSLS